MNVGDRLDRYIVEERIGEGGMATVYLARHETLRSLHALKVLRIDVPSIKARLLTEGRVQASLRHPNVVAVTDVLDTNGVCALVMEYVDGPGLDAWIDRPNRPRDLPTILHLFRGMTLGVAAAHKAGLVHRDLKPDNVLLAGSNAGLVPKVTDFGLVKVTESSVTQSGVLMGTPEYMSPEQVRDSAGVDWRSDLWSLGVILYEMLGGFQPFNAEEILEVYNLVTKGDYVPIEQLRPDLPPSVVSVVAGLLQKNPDDRIQTAEEVLARLFPDGTVVSHPPKVSTEQLAPSVSTESRTRTVPMDQPFQETTVPMDPLPAAPVTSTASAAPPILSPHVAAALGASFGVVAFFMTLMLALALWPSGEVPVEPVPIEPIEPVAPVPVPVVERSVEFSNSTPLTFLEVDGEPVGLTEGRATVSLELGSHRVHAQVGICENVTPGCGETCPPGCGSWVEELEVVAGKESQTVALELTEVPVPSPAPEVVPSVVPSAVPAVASPGRVVSASSYATWLAKHPEWERDAAISSGRATPTYLRKWKNGTPKGNLTQIPWAAAKAYCASRGGLPELDALPLTWKPGITQEWRVSAGKPAWRRYDGVTSTSNPRNESFTFTGARCKR